MAVLLALTSGSLTDSNVFSPFDTTSANPQPSGGYSNSSNFGSALESATFTIPNGVSVRGMLVSVTAYYAPLSGSFTVELHKAGVVVATGSVDASTLPLGISISGNLPQVYIGFDTVAGAGSNDYTLYFPASNPNPWQYTLGTTDTTSPARQLLTTSTVKPTSTDDLLITGSQALASISVPAGSNLAFNSITLLNSSALVFPSDDGATTQLNLVNLTVSAGGALTVGTAAAPIPPRSRVNLYGTGNILFSPNSKISIVGSPRTSGKNVAWCQVVGGGYLLGTLTSGSSTITAVTGMDGAAMVGYGVKGTGIPTGTTVTAFDTTANTITMSAAATATTVNAQVTVYIPAGTKVFNVDKDTGWQVGDTVALTTSSGANSYSGVTYGLITAVTASTITAQGFSATNQYGRNPVPTGNIGTLGDLVAGRTSKIYLAVVNRNVVVGSPSSNNTCSFTIDASGDTSSYLVTWVRIANENSIPDAGLNNGLRASLVIKCTSTLSPSAVLSYCAFLGSFYASLAAVTSGRMTIDNNIVVAGYAYTPSSDAGVVQVGGDYTYHSYTLTNNLVCGGNSSSAGYFLTAGGGTYVGNHVSNASVGFMLRMKGGYSSTTIFPPGSVNQFTQNFASNCNTAFDFGNVSSFTATGCVAMKSSTGFTISAVSPDFLLDSCFSYGCRSVIYSTSPAVAAGVVRSLTTGVDFSIIVQSTLSADSGYHAYQFDQCSLLAGATAGHIYSTSYSGSATKPTLKVTLNACSLGTGNLASTSNTMNTGSVIRSQRTNNVAGDHRSVLSPNITVTLDKVAYKTAAPSEKVSSGAGSTVYTPFTMTQGSAVLTAVSSVSSFKIGVYYGIAGSSPAYVGKVLAVDAAAKTVTMDTVSDTTGSPGLSFIVSPASSRKLIPVDAGATANISVAYLLSSSPAFDGRTPRLIQRANPALGIPNDVVLASAPKVPATGSWQSLSGTTVAGTDDGLVEVALEFIAVNTSNSGGMTVNVDDWTVT